MCDIDEYKELPYIQHSHFTDKQKSDMLSEVLDKFDRKIEAANYSESYSDWKNLFKFLDKMNSRFILSSDIDEEEKNQRIAALYNENSIEKLFVAARNGIPNLDNFLQNIIIEILSILADYIKYPHILFFRYNLLDDIVSILNDPNSKIVFIHILSIISNCVEKTEEYRKEGLFAEDVESINDYYSHLLNNILEICWTKDEDNCYQLIQSNIIETATKLIKFCKFDVDQAAETYERFKTILVKQKDKMVQGFEPEKAYIKSLLNTFRTFLKKEVSYYNNLMADEVYLILIQFLDSGNIKSILKLMEPLLDTPEFVDKFAQTDFLEKICDIIETPPHGVQCLPVYYVYALKMIAKAVHNSHLAAQKIAEIKLTSRSQLYSQPSIHSSNPEIAIPGNITQESKRALLLLFVSLMDQGIGPTTDAEFAYLPTFLESSIECDDHEILECTLKIIIFIIHRFTDFHIDIEDRLHEILDDDDLEDLHPYVQEIGSILFPEEE